MLSFFFVPATKIDKITAIRSLGVDSIIVDFEDAVLAVDRERLVGRIRHIPDFENLWYRVPVRNSFEETLDATFLQLIKETGARKIVLPKLISCIEITGLLQGLNAGGDAPWEFIILIEHPRLLVEIGQVLQSEELTGMIKGIGIGSHDLMSFLGSAHEEPQLAYPRTHMLYLAKAYGKLAIDIASMNMSNEIEFKREVLWGIRNGFDAKFLIHPGQFQWMQEQSAESAAVDIDRARKIIAALPADYQGKEIEPFILDGIVVEKPHVERALIILKNNDNEQ